ncbi:MAG: hypothetical protein ABFD81_15790 [Syntrophaceae bacterium]
MNKVILMAGLFCCIFSVQTAFAPAAYPQGAAKTQAVMEEPNTDLQKAHAFFLKKEFKKSAAEIRKATEFVKNEAGKAGEEGKKALTSSYQELTKLADDVEKGAVHSDKQLKDVFSRAEHALAHNYYLKASESWTKKETSQAGHTLNSAARHLELSAKWSEQKLDAGMTEAISTGRKVSAKMVQGSGYVSDEVSKSLKNMGDAISGFGKKIMPEKQ